MRILDRYLLKGLLWPFLWCLAAFIFLYIIVDLFGHLDEILRQKASLSILWDYYLSLVPIIFVQTAPVAALLSTLYTLGNLSRHNEIMAMRTGGVSLGQLIRPFLCLGIFLSTLVFVVNDRIVPQASFTSTTIKEEAMAKKKGLTKGKKIIKQLTLYGLKNRLFYIESFDSEKRTLEGIIILQHDEHQNLTSKIVARQGRWEENRWRFYHCTIYEFDEEGNLKENPLYFEEKSMDIAERPQDFLRYSAQTNFMSYRQLKEHIQKLAGLNIKVIRNLLVDLHYKMAFPFTSLVIILVGISFGLTAGKGGALFSVGTCLAIGFLYYVVTSVSLALGKAGILLPFLAAWLSNILFFSLGISLLERTH